jgi:hypothetical protein
MEPEGESLTGAPLRRGARGPVSGPRSSSREDGSVADEEAGRQQLGKNGSIYSSENRGQKRKNGLFDSC